MKQRGGRAILKLGRSVICGILQGDQAAWTNPPVDIDVKVAFYYKDLILKRNFQINVSGRFCTC